MSDPSAHQGPYLTVRRRDGAADTARVEVSGELDLATTALLEAVLRTAVAAGHQHVHLDARGLSFCDATGFRLLVEMSTELSVRGGRLTILGPCPPLDMLLRLTDHGDGAIDVIPAERVDGLNGQPAVGPDRRPPSDAAAQDDLKTPAAP